MNQKIDEWGEKNDRLNIELLINMACFKNSSFHVHTGFMSWQSGPSWRSVMGPRMPTNHQGFPTFFCREFLQKKTLFCHGKPRWRGGFTSFFSVCWTCGCACFFGVKFYVCLNVVWCFSVFESLPSFEFPIINPELHKKHMLRTCVCLNSYLDWKCLKLVTSTFDVSYFWGCRDCQVAKISPFAGSFRTCDP